MFYLKNIFINLYTNKTPHQFSVMLMGKVYKNLCHLMQRCDGHMGEVKVQQEV